MKLTISLFVIVALTACASTPPRISGVTISRVGIINALPKVGRDIYTGLTIFENRNDNIFVDWNFPTMVFEELSQGLLSRGIDAVDLTNEVPYGSDPDALFETGYSLKFGLTSHVVTEKASVHLSTLLKTHNLDVIALLRPARYNEDAPFKLPPRATAAFGFFGYYGGLFRDNPQHTFVQIKARVIAGDPPKVIEDLHGSNLVDDEEEALRKSLFGSELKARFRDQVIEAVSTIIDGFDVSPRQQ